MAHISLFLPRRHEVLEVPAPNGGVCAVSVMAGEAPIENVFDAPANPDCGFGSCLLDWLEHAKDILGCNRRHIQVADDRVRIAC